MSDGRINMCATDEIVAVRASLSYPRSRAHGSLMLYAWMVLSPIASYIARYCKPTLVPPYWFNFHRIMQVLTWLVLVLISQSLAVLMTCISIIVQFGTADHAGTHGIIGWIIIATCSINLLLGVFRNQISGFDPKNKRSDDDKGPRSVDAYTS
jgi:hypothetical protein